MPSRHERKTRSGVVTVCPEGWNELWGWRPKDSGHPCRELAPRDPGQAQRDGHRASLHLKLARGTPESRGCIPQESSHDQNLAGGILLSSSPGFQAGSPVLAFRSKSNE